MNEVAAGLSWIYTTLSQDAMFAALAPGGVWRSYAEPAAATPYAIMAFQAGSDVTTMNAFRIVVDAMYQVKAVGPASQLANITASAARIDTLLGSPPTSGAGLGGAVLASYRQSPLEVDELVSGEMWTNIGGLYRLIIQQAPPYAMRALGSPVPL